MRRAIQAKLLKLLSELMGSGFSLQDSLRFMMKLYYQNTYVVQQLNEILLALSNGTAVAKAFQRMNFSPIVYAEIQLSEVHGHLQQTFAHLSQRLLQEESKLNQLKRLLSYPSLLIVFLFSLVLFMKWVLLPKMSILMEGKVNIGWEMINHFFLILFILVVIIYLIYVCFSIFLRHKSAIEKYEWLNRLPFIHYWCCYHCTCYFCDAWGYLLQTGIETHQIIQILSQNHYIPWMRELAHAIDEGMMNGVDMATTISQYHFLHPGLVNLIRTSEVKGQLGKELEIYGQELWKDWIALLEKGLDWVQPLIFIIIGLMIIGMYAAVLLPMYTGLE